MTRNYLIKKLILKIFAVSFLIFPFSAIAQIQWPEITQDSKPWTRWWWMGNILPDSDVTAAMEAYHNAGLGGLEITPIYGVKGYEDSFIDFLSPEYMNKLEYTLKEAGKIGLGIDMATGTGWPFGGPWVSDAEACKYITHKTYTLNAGESLSEPVEFIQKPIIRAVNRRADISEIKDPITANENLQALAIDQVRFPKPLPLHVLMAYSENGTVINLTDKVGEDKKLNWVAPEGKWTLYALFQGWHGKMVERAGPGGEGNVIDHFSETALDHYLKKFDEAFKGRDITPFRAFFNDSYEVDDASGEADWTPGFLNEFSKRRGYDLLHHLPALFSEEKTDEKHVRVLCDYRQTISELLLEKFTTRWHDWAQSKGSIIRNQAHGSPANILDLYAAIDIPECEGEDMLRFKFASSASHVTGKKLTASESATWLNEHFLSTLGEAKFALDRFLLGGVNHIFYHGTTFSPRNEPWPGWMFYASVHFGPTNTWWKDFSKLNEYVARCQSFLQEGTPDNDILLYYNFYDRISDPGRAMLQHFAGGGQGTTARNVGEVLMINGYAFDFISDKQLARVKFDDKQLHTNGATYRTIMIPDCRYMPVETFENLINLAKSGSAIIIYKHLPESVEGFANLAERQKRYEELKSLLNFRELNNSGINEAKIGKGLFLVGDNIELLAEYAKVRKESMAEQGLQFIRRKHENGHIYFIANWGEKPLNGWIPVSVDAKTIALFDPMTEQYGLAAIREPGNSITRIFLQLNQGESCILKTFNNQIEGETFRYLEPCGEKQNIEGEWEVSFTEGGPELPASVKISGLKSWTELGGETTKNFSGTAKYSIAFKKPKTKCDGWYLDLGNVAHSARVKLNGVSMGTLIFSPFRIYVPAHQLNKKNILEVEVTNLMANRIAYMDKEGIQYKKFYNINFPARLSENRGEDGLFTAKKWEPKESGLLGPVTLTPVNKVNIE
ncbi:MAG: glycoside hydrolase family 2 protein [Bacteroidales bacterium]|nr:glycoside hydrolase family 2 protein [Bacteroidales bacterium]